MMIVPTEHLSKVKQVTLGCPSVGIQLRDGLAKLDTSACAGSQIGQLDLLRWPFSCILLDRPEKGMESR